ncbi:MAG: transposase family protein [Planctomycetes bacterium]|nr:transposase family protein [Planctomycetota bacterium]
MASYTHPSADWVVKQLREAFPFDQAPRHLIFDRDSIFSSRVVRVIKSFGIKPKRTNYKSPWQNGTAERWVKNCRNELLNHVIVFNEHHLRKLLRKYVDFYNSDRTHYNLNKDSPEARPIQIKPSNSARVVALPRVGGLHHRYEWRDAA